MRTMTVTYHHTCNYGAVLQAYALQKTIEGMGHQNLLLEYPYNGASRSKVPYNPKRAIRGAIVKILGLPHRKEHRVLMEHFKEFHDKQLNLTRIFESMDDLRRNCPEVDCFITGSDQVFNLRTLPEFLPARLLEFGPEDAIRFSYAASLEARDYSETEKARVASSLGRFKGVSLREPEARDYIESFAPEADPIDVLDPIFLLPRDHWERFAQQPRLRGPFILVYQVQGNRYVQDIADQLKKRLGLPIVSVCNGAMKRIKADKTLFDVSPQEFIGLYLSAAVVVAASFHGAALGLNFGVPTYAAVKEGTSNRIGSLMNRFGLNSYCVGKAGEINPWIHDWSQINELIEKERARSLRFLESMLNK